MNVVESLPISSAGLVPALQIAVGGVAVSALVLLVARLLWRRSEPLRYGVLLTGIIGMLAVPALVGLGRSVQETGWFAGQPEEQVLRITADMLPTMLARAEPDAPQRDAAAGAGEWIGAGLLVLWIAGTLVGVGRLVHGLWKQSRTLVALPWHADFWTVERAAVLARQLGLRRFPTIHTSPAVPMPMVVGIWRPTIVLPEPAPATWQQPQWEAVLLHEAAHIARGDHWAALAQRLAITLFWWCPLVYVVARRLNALRENICDDCAITATCDRIAYAELLVESADHFLRLTAAAIPLGLLDAASGGLQARVTRLLEKERSIMTRLSLSGKLLGALVLVTAGLLTTGGTVFSGGPPQTPKKIQIKIIVDGKEIDLNDAELWQHIEAAKKKAGEEQAKALQLLAGAVKEKTGKTVVVKELAFSPDGRFLASGDGKRIVLWDAQTGKVVINEGAQAKPDAPAKAPAQADAVKLLAKAFAAQAAPGKADPRVEELVKQAEAIKPGSGAEIRKALQAAPKPGDEPAKATWVAKPHAPGAAVRVYHSDGGKKTIIIAIEDDGKVQQLNPADLLKLLDKNMHWQFELDVPKHKTTDKARVVEVQNKVLVEKKAAPPAQDLEALSRQLERINAELNELRKRLETPKK
jgi:beta-lactamase regulating signal transducer with metallopeptidase domain